MQRTRLFHCEWLGIVRNLLEVLSWLRRRNCVIMTHGDLCLSLFSAIEIAIQPALLFKAPFLVAAAAYRNRVCILGSGQKRKGWPQYFATSYTLSVFHLFFIYFYYQKVFQCERAIIAIVDYPLVVTTAGCKNCRETA